MKTNLNSTGRLILATLVALGVSLAGCSKREESGLSPAAAVKRVTLRQEWFPNSNYAGAIYGAKRFAAKHHIQLVIQPGSDNIDPVKTVISGESLFGDAAADKIVAANSKGADLVIIGVLNNDSPTCFLTKAEANIRTPNDFVGKKVGVLTGTSTEYVYRAMLAKCHLDKSQFTEIEAPFDLATFIAGAYDVRPAFVYDEPVSLDLQNVAYNIISPRDYGVSFLGTVYFTKRKLIEEQPQLVQNFIDTVADGWRAALKSPAEAIDLIKEFDPTIDAKRETLSLRKSLSLFQGKAGHPLTLNRESWDAMLAELVHLGVIPGNYQDHSLALQFVDDYYKRNQ
jgi:NitT/TauT family transport system substrate-binding protein